MGIGNGPYRLTDGSIIVGPGRRVSFPLPGPSASSKGKKVKGKKVKSRDLQYAMLFSPGYSCKRTKEDQLQGSVCVCVSFTCS